LGGRLQRAEQAVRFIVDAGREEQGARIAGAAALAELKVPEPAFLERLSAAREQGGDELAARGIVDVDVPVPGIAHQQIVAERSEARRSQRHPPGRIEIAAGDQATLEDAILVEDI